MDPAGSHSHGFTMGEIGEDQANRGGRCFLDEQSSPWINLAVGPKSLFLTLPVAKPNIAEHQAAIKRDLNPVHRSGAGKAEPVLGEEAKGCG